MKISTNPLAKVDTDYIRVTDVTYEWERNTSSTSDGHPHLGLSIPDFTLSRAERVFIYGPSGCGKSTLLGLCAGVLSARTGQVRLMGHDLSQTAASKRDQLRVDHIGYIFQQFNLIPYLSVLENVILPCRFSRKRRHATIAEPSTASETKISEADLRQRAGTILEQLGLNASIWSKKAMNLSIGQQQRVAAARALLGSPEIIIADEPSSALDQHHQEEFMQCLLEQCRQTQASLLFVSHDMRLAAQFDRLVACENWLVTVPKSHEVAR